MPKNVNTLDLIKTVTFFASKNIIKKVGGGVKRRLTVAEKCINIFLQNEYSHTSETVWVQF